MRQGPRVLLIAEECDPDGMAGPLIGWKLSELISQFADVTLVTREKYETQVLRRNPRAEMVFLPDRGWAGPYRRLLEKRVFPILHNWPLRHFLRYPLYAQFNQEVFSRFAGRVQEGEFDLVHALTPLIPRYPIKLAQVCFETPLVLGPLNGGLAVPQGFSSIQRRDFSGAPLLRALSKWLPGYSATYKTAARILVGTEDTRQQIQQIFSLPEERFLLLAENGIDRVIQRVPQAASGDDRLELLFVGRLVPFKGAHLLVKALVLLPPPIRHQVRLTIVGDGPERENIQALIKKYSLEAQVKMVGWVAQADTSSYYSRADLFCYPSVRESGGAVVLEAMAHGLPCIVVDHGGIADYVGETAGVRIAARSPEQVTQDLAQSISQLFHDVEKRQTLSAAACERAKRYTWQAKGERIGQLYESLLPVSLC